MPVKTHLPLVSVIVPTHDRRDFLREALRSVEGQSYPHLEIIVVDDGSTDGTGEMIRHEFPAVRYVFQENRGPSAARNAGIRLARGEWLSFLDSDDLWKRRKLERQIRFLLTHPRYSVCYTDEIWIRRGVRVNPRKIHRKYSGWMFPHTLPLCIISPSSVILHRRVFEAIGFFDEDLPVCEDYDLWIRLTARFPVYFLEEKLIVKQGGHDDQLSNRSWGNDRYRVEALLKVMDASEGYSPGERELARRQMLEKCRVLAGGFRKHGKDMEADYYEDLLDRFSTAPQVTFPRMVSEPAP